MTSRTAEDNLMCSTSEAGEKALTEAVVHSTALEIGQRIMEVFGYQRISNMVFRLHSNSEEIRAVIHGDELPSTELLITIQKVTGVSLDWLVTGIGPKYRLLPQDTQETKRTEEPRRELSYQYPRSVLGTRS